jgi:hypothetical protein
MGEILLRVTASGIANTTAIAPSHQFTKRHQFSISGQLRGIFYIFSGEIRNLPD